MAHSIIRLPAVSAETGRPKSTLYALIARGLFTRPIKLGPRASGWPKAEIDALNAARNRI
jgi:prophage regulatory protein